MAFTGRMRITTARKIPDARNHIFPVRVCGFRYSPEESVDGKERIDMRHQRRADGIIEKIGPQRKCDQDECDDPFLLKQIFSDSLCRNHSPQMR